MKKFLLAMIMAALLLSSVPAGAAKITISDDAFLDLHGYAQTWLYVPIAQDEFDLTPDFYMRRIRLKFAGQVNKYVKFTVVTLNANMGKGGNMDAPTRIFDAWMEFDLASSFKLNVGLLKLPFSRHMQQSGASLHGLDFHGAFLGRKGGVPHRDMGVMARGLLLGGKLDYRLAILDGIEDPAVDKTSNFRFLGRLGLNVFDAEPGYFWAGTYLGKKKILSFGASFDLEPGVAPDGDLYYAFAFDALADIPHGDNGFVATLCFYMYGPGGAVPEGMGLWGDLGYRIVKVEPLVALEWYSPSEGDDGKRLALLGGLNYFLHGHNATIKFQFGMSKVGGSDDWGKEMILQAQLLF